MSTEDKIAQASTEDWCERSDEGHAWSYTSHAGQPRIETRTCVLCGYLSVQPVREALTRGDLAPAGPSVSGQPTPAAVDLDAIEEKWLRQCGACDAGMATSCVCAEGDPRNVIANLVDEVKQLRENGRRLAHHAARLRSQRDEARAERYGEWERLRREHGEAQHDIEAYDNGLQRISGALHEAGIPIDSDVATVACAAIRNLAAERDSLREERNRLREAVINSAEAWEQLAEEAIERRDETEERSRRQRHEAVAHAYRACANAARAILAAAPGEAPAEPLAKRLGEEASRLLEPDAEPPAAPVQPEERRDDNPPPVGEGAALIAATEQQIADALPADDATAAAESAAHAWQQTARLLACAVDDRPHGCDGLCEQAAEHGMHPPVAPTPPCGHQSGIHDEYCDVINDTEPEPDSTGDDELDEALAGAMSALDWAANHISLARSCARAALGSTPDTGSAA